MNSHMRNLAQNALELIEAMAELYESELDAISRGTRSDFPIWASTSTSREY